MAPSAINSGDAQAEVLPTKKDVKPALFHRSLAERPHMVDHASGSYLYLKDGRKILDACGGAAVAAIGHGNEEVIAATMDQMRKVSYIHTGTYTTESAEQLAHAVLDPSLCSYDHKLRRAFFVGSGSEANDAAMKLSRQYWFEKGEKRRRFFVARRQAYHGNTVGAMSLSSIPARKRPYQDVLLPSVSHVRPAYAYQYQTAGESEEDYTVGLIKELEDEFLRLGPENVISFIAEPIVGAASGCTVPPKGYFKGIRELCDRYNILLHLDEIMSGAGRTGKYFAFEWECIRPDIVTMGKGLGGGYAPIAAMLVGEKVIDSLSQGTSSFNHGQTYQAHPVTCATALAVQQCVKKNDLVRRCEEQGKKLEGLLKQAFADCKYVGDVRGRGLFWALEFVSDKSTREHFAADVAFGSKVLQKAFDLGIAVYPTAGSSAGLRGGDSVILAPPYTVTDEELDIMVSVLKQAYMVQEAKIDTAPA